MLIFCTVTHCQIYFQKHYSLSYISFIWPSPLMLIFMKIFKCTIVQYGFVYYVLILEFSIHRPNRVHSSDKKNKLSTRPILLSITTPIFYPLHLQTRYIFLTKINRHWFHRNIYGVCMQLNMCKNVEELGKNFFECHC